jgi:hypothetical protein
MPADELEERLHAEHLPSDADSRARPSGSDTALEGCDGDDLAGTVDRRHDATSQR